MRERTSVHHLDDMIEYGERAVSYLNGLGLEALLADRMRTDAVARAVEIMGEACKRIPEEVKTRYPAIPWKLIARMRDKLIHHYDGLDWAIVWETASTHVPAALILLREARAQLFAESSPPEVRPDA